MLGPESKLPQWSELDYASQPNSNRACILPSEQRGSNAIGSLGEPIRKRVAVQGRPFALVHAYAVSMHHPSQA